MVDVGTLATVAAIISAFGTTVLVFRVERELRMAERAERNWIPWADWLVLGATLASLVCLLIVLLRPNGVTRQLATAGCAGAIVSLFGYPLGILAHYRFIFGAGR